MEDGVSLMLKCFDLELDSSVLRCNRALVAGLATTLRMEDCPVGDDRVLSLSLKDLEHSSSVRILVRVIVVGLCGFVCNCWFHFVSKRISN